MGKKKGNGILDSATLVSKSDWRKKEEKFSEVELICHAVTPQKIFK